MNHEVQSAALAVRRMYSFDRAVYDRARRQAIGLNVGLTLTAMTTPASVAGINLSSLFSGAYQSVQADLGLTIGGTPLASGTTPPVGTLGGTLTKDLATPIWFKCTTAGAIGSGARFAAYTDGSGTTPVATGISPVAGAPVSSLSSVLTGTTMAWAAGTAALDNVWKATCAAVADQSGNGKHVTQGTASLQPVITIGLNGKPGLLFDGVDDYLGCAAFSTVAGMLRYALFRIVSHVNFAGIADNTPGNAMLLSLNSAGAGSIRAYNGASLAGGVLAVGTPGRVSATYNGASSSIKVGSLAAVNGDAGSGAPAAGLFIGCRADLALFSNIELFGIVHAPAASTTAADAAINTPAGWGASAFAV